MLELMISPLTGWVARWLEHPACDGVVPGSIPGLAFLFSFYTEGLPSSPFLAVYLLEIDQVGEWQLNAIRLNGKKKYVFVSRIDMDYILVVQSTNAEVRQEVGNRQVA